MKGRQRDVAIFVVLGICIAVTVLFTPINVWRGPFDAVHMAPKLLLLTLIGLGGLRVLHCRRIERAWVAAFLALMPFVYLRGAMHVGEPRMIVVELLGQIFFVMLALGGLYFSPWFFAVGFVVHGLAWDSWHVSGVLVPPWYPIACIMVDVGLGVYGMLMVPEFRRGSSKNMRKLQAVGNNQEGV